MVSFVLGGLSNAVIISIHQASGPSRKERGNNKEFTARTINLKWNYFERQNTL